MARIPTLQFLSSLMDTDWWYQSLCLVGVASALFFKYPQLKHSFSSYWTMSNHSNKRQKMEFVADDLIDPISHELPFKPVFAEDGRIYDEPVIKQHFGSCARRQVPVRSPVTNEPMGQHLVPALQIKNHIQQLIDSGALNGDLVEVWKEKQEMEKLFHKANQGDAGAMTCLGMRFKDEGNYEKAFAWFKRSDDAGNLGGMALVGYMLLTGKGVDQNVSEGLVHISVAATRGNDMAAYNLGYSFAKGLFGLPVDTKAAKQWLEKALHTRPDKGVVRLSDFSREKAQRLLESFGGPNPTAGSP